MIYLNIVVVLCLGLLIGTEFAVSAFIGPILRGLGDAQALAIRLFASKLGTVMPFWYGGSLALLIFETVLGRHAPGLGLRITAIAIWATVIVFTIAVLVPINNRMTQLAPGDIPAESLRAHQRWEMLHHLRVVALVASLASFLLALLS
jgi:uncharacterized membrane protein